MISVTAIVNTRRVTWEDGELTGSEEDVRALRVEELRAEREGVECGHVMGPRFCRDFLQHQLGFLLLVRRLWPDAEIVWNTPEPTYSIPEGAVS